MAETVPDNTAPSDQTVPRVGPGVGDAGIDRDAQPAEDVSSAQDTAISLQVGDEANVLGDLIANAKDQDELEKDISRQADQMLVEQADERDQKRLERTLTQKEKLLSQVRRLQQRLGQAGSTIALKLRAEIDHLQPQIDGLNQDLEQIQHRMDERHAEADAGAVPADQVGNARMPSESRRDFLIRTGKITPFSRMGQTLQRASSSLAEVMLDAEEQGDGETDDVTELEDVEPVAARLMSHRNLLMPGFQDVTSSEVESTVESIDSRPRKKRRVQRKSKLADDSDPEVSAPSPGDASGDDYVPADGAKLEPATSEDDFDDEGVVFQGTDIAISSAKKRKGKGRNDSKEVDGEDLAGVDDGNEHVYQARLVKWVNGRRAARVKVRLKKNQTVNNEDIVKDEDDLDASDAVPAINGTEENGEREEWQSPHPTRPDAEFDAGFRIPGDIYPSLFDYQKTGVQWLWELHSQQVGGIIGDEMGLGKTIQIISFIAGLHYSGLLTKPVIVVTPATVMKQWVNEFHRWWPPLRVSILHTSGSGMMDVRTERQLEDEMERRAYGSKIKATPGGKAAGKIVDRVLKEGHVLVTTYSGLQSYAELLIPIDWGYAVLDEGHKIRNPNTSITIYCKELRTANRIILSGTPMQNNLTELWSLFDFIFPMRLGTLVNFRTQFEIPIKQGGYANASNLQVETALRCAETLKDAISPYLLQRFKVDVAADLPKKTEQVLFCRLTKLQREAYEAFLSSNEMNSIIQGKRQALYGIDILRKICNHPDLQDHKHLSIKPGYNYGSGSKSGKMQVVKALLELWRDTGHKTLLFAQHRIMLDILEKFVKTLGGFKYRRMDGSTQIKDRQTLVDEFNNDPSLHVFLLTTKVGGLGVNLTGADRVIIYDPDWNPSTDVQARERAWRLGQKREVMIYRLMTAGTIEEKIYHRQIFKQFLTNKILRDPKQRQTFQLKDLHDLFTLGGEDEVETETGGLFKGTETKFSEADARDAVIDETSNGTTDSSKLGRIVGIAHREEFRGDPNSAATTAPATPVTTDGETSSAQPSDNHRLLSTIFARSGVQSALEHDAIIGSNSSKPGAIKADPQIIAREAKRVAAMAAKELQQASEAARSVPIGTPTWTGTVGVAGRPDYSRGSPAPRGGVGGRGGRGGSSASSRGLPSSSAVLANLATRQGQHASTPSSDAQASQPRGREFVQLIKSYLLTHGGAVYTQMLIDHFNRFCGTPERTAEFKEMLKAIAVLDKGDGDGGGRAISGRGRTALGMRARQAQGRGGRARWVLKKEFGGTG